MFSRLILSMNWLRSYDRKITLWFLVKSFRLNFPWLKVNNRKPIKISHIRRWVKRIGLRDHAKEVMMISFIKNKKICSVFLFIEKKTGNNITHNCLLWILLFSSLFWCFNHFKTTQLIGGDIIARITQQSTDTMTTISTWF